MSSIGDNVIKKIKEVNLNYIDYGTNKEGVLVYLHGWGQNIEMMKPIADPFQNNFRIIIVDLPGHGSSTEPPFAWQVDEFVECIKELMDELKIDNPTLIGHSFGGKISMLYGSRYNTSKLVLLGSPYRREIAKISLKTKVLKSLKKVPVLNKFEDFAKRHIGSADYRNASGVMREIIVNTVNYDITDQLSKIKAETLIIWGTNDEAVSIEDARSLEKLIKNAGLVEYEGCSHYAYLERLGQTISVLKVFLEGR